MFLSDVDLRNAMKTWDIYVSPLNLNDIQPATIDVHLWNTFMRYKKSDKPIDSRADQTDELEKIVLKEWEAIKIRGKEFMLACTKEEIGVSNGYAAQIEGKSSIWRLWPIVHTTAWFIDPWNRLIVTLELFNTNDRDVILYVGDYIWQVKFSKLLTPCEKWYGHEERNSKYMNSTTTEPSKNYKNF
jgi:dCTP deaminase